MQIGKLLSSKLVDAYTEIYHFRKITNEYLGKIYSMASQIRKNMLPRSLKSRFGARVQHSCESPRGVIIALSPYRAKSEEIHEIVKKNVPRVLQDMLKKL